MSHKVLILAGDGIGPDIMREAEKVLAALVAQYGLDITVEHALVGGAAYDDCGTPLPEQTLQLALASDAVLFGAVGGPKWDGLARDLRPERGRIAAPACGTCPVCQPEAGADLPATGGCLVAEAGTGQWTGHPDRAAS